VVDDGQEAAAGGTESEDPRWHDLRRIWWWRMYVGLRLCAYLICASLYICEM
jgi:hypothetical protein